MLTVLPKVLSIRQSYDVGLLLPLAIADRLFLIWIVKLRFWLSPGLIFTAFHIRNFALVLPVLAFLSSVNVPPPASNISAYSRTSPTWSLKVNSSSFRPLFFTERVYVIRSPDFAVTVVASALFCVRLLADFVCTNEAEQRLSLIHNVESAGHGWHCGSSFNNLGFCGHRSGSGMVNVFVQASDVLSPREVFTVRVTL